MRIKCALGWRMAIGLKQDPWTSFSYTNQETQYVLSQLQHLQSYRTSWAPILLYAPKGFRLALFWVLLFISYTADIHWISETPLPLALGNLDIAAGITITRLRTFSLRHFVYRHFVYWNVVYCDFPCWNRSWRDETNTISIEPGLVQGILPNSNWDW